MQLSCTTCWPKGNNLCCLLGCDMGRRRASHPLMVHDASPFPTLTSSSLHIASLHPCSSVSRRARQMTLTASSFSSRTGRALQGVGECG